MVNRVHFTKTALSAIPAPSTGRSTYYDSLVPKLALRVTAAGARAFYVIKRDAASMAWIRLGSFPEISVEQARREAESVLGEFAKGDNPAKAKREEKAKPTLGEAFERYCTLHAGPHGVKSTADQRAIWERCIGTMPAAERKRHGRARTKHPAGVDWSARKLDAIDNPEVRALHSGIGATNPTLANRALEILSSVYNRAIDWGYRGPNPVTGIRGFKENKRDRFLKAEELPRFFAELSADTSDDFQHFVLLGLLTGARRDNVLSAKWEDFDLTGATWRIPDSKNGEPIHIPLVNEALEILRSRGPKPRGFVFPADSKSGYLTPPKKRWQALVKRMGVDDLRMHDLRRSLGSWQAITGASLTIIGKSLGHKSADATMIYARLSMDPVRASVNTATSAMLEAGGLKPSGKVEPLERSKTAA